MSSAERTIRMDPSHPFPQDANGWRFRSGLRYDEVEAILDSLEMAGVKRREVQIEADGMFLVRWQEVV